ncbi:MAG: biotin/lipoyl-binding protein [Defluviitaleaceae bacterium]|nr:biotin/lipoyl-binding protein [Defluviitaleaceae bacterium]MCL2239100.1 biotin/lipoyl-binding protein [Defluviitaleaceae bacterium]
MKISTLVRIFTLLFLAGFLLSGCFALPMEEDYIPPAVFALPASPPWRTAEVARGDVVLFSTISATHQAAREEIIRFGVAGALITGVYVQVGDAVSAGDVIASLDRSGVAGDVERLIREEARLSLRIAQLNERHEHTLWMAEVSGIAVDDSFYINTRRDLREDLEMLRRELDYLRRQYENRLIRAGMDGVVTRAIVFAERSFSVFGNHVATISDQTLSIFVVSMREAQVMQPGERFEMDVAGNLVWVEVVDPEEMGIHRPETAWIEAILVADGGGVFASNAMGRIHAVFAASYDVLHVPFRAVNYVNGRHFVYVLEDGLRRLRHVEVGLEGTNYTEILDGLRLGEVVVI